MECCKGVPLCPENMGKKGKRMNRKNTFIFIGAIFFLCGVFLLYSKIRQPEMPLDGRCRIEAIYDDRICIEVLADHQNVSGTYTVPLPPEITQCCIYDEPLVKMPVLCSYTELREAWKPERTYDFHFIEENSSPVLIQLEEASEDEESFAYVAEGELGQLFYSVSQVGEDGVLKIIPVRYMAWDEAVTVESLAAQGIAEENITFVQELGCVCISYPQEAKQVALAEDARCYTLLSAYAERCSRQDMRECFRQNAGSDIVYRLFLDGNQIVCAICYNVV